MSEAESDASAAKMAIEVTVTFETILGLLAAFFIGFFGPVVAGIGLLASLIGGQPKLAVLAALAFAFSGRFAILVAKMAAEASVGKLPVGVVNVSCDQPLCLPFALAMAALLPHYHWLWRPWLALWWLAHFGFAAAFGHLVAMSLIERLDAATAVVAIPLAVVVHFAFLFASNLYLVLASRVALSSPRWCVRIWRYRFAIDFTVALAMVLASRR